MEWEIKIETSHKHLQNMQTISCEDIITNCLRACQIGIIINLYHLGTVLAIYTTVND